MILEKEYLKSDEAAQRLNCDSEILLEYASKGQVSCYAKFHNKLIFTVNSRTQITEKKLKIYLSERLDKLNKQIEIGGEKVFIYEKQAWYMAGREEYCRVPKMPRPPLSQIGKPSTFIMEEDEVNGDSKKSYLFTLFPIQFSYCENSDVLVYKLPSSVEYQQAVSVFNTQQKYNFTHNFTFPQMFPKEYLLREGGDYAIYSDTIQLRNNAKKDEIIAIVRSPNIFDGISHYVSRRPERLRCDDILDILNVGLYGKAEIKHLHSDDKDEIKFLFDVQEVTRADVLFLAGDIKELERKTSVSIQKSDSGNEEQKEENSLAITVEQNLVNDVDGESEKQAPSSRHQGIVEGLKMIKESLKNQEKKFTKGNVIGELEKYSKGTPFNPKDEDEVYPTARFANAYLKSMPDRPSIIIWADDIEGESFEYSTASLDRVIREVKGSR